MLSVKAFQGLQTAYITTCLNPFDATILPGRWSRYHLYSIFSMVCIRSIVDILCKLQRTWLRARWNSRTRINSSPGLLASRPRVVPRHHKRLSFLFLSYKVGPLCVMKNKYGEILLIGDVCIVVFILLKYHCTSEIKYIRKSYFNESLNVLVRCFRCHSKCRVFRKPIIQATW